MGVASGPGFPLLSFVLPKCRDHKRISASIPNAVSVSPTTVVSVETSCFPCVSFKTLQVSETHKVCFRPDLSRLLFFIISSAQVFRTSELPNFRSPELHQKTPADRFVVLYPLHGFGKKSGTTHDPYFLRFLFKGNRVGDDQFTQLRIVDLFIGIP